MDWIGLVGNVIAVFVGLGIYIIIANTKWGKAHSKAQYAIMLVCVILAVLVGWGIKVLIRHFM